MNRIDEWTQFISKCLKSETELLGIQSRHDLYEDSAKATFIRVVLEQFLPSSFAVGSGRVIDASGNSTDDLDIIVYRRDFPQLNLPGSTNVFLYESVLATFEIKTKLVRKTFFDAMDNCASLGQLSPAVNPVALRKLALRNKLTLDENDQFVHEDPLKSARFHLIGRPPSFVYAFSGYQTSLKQLKENIDLWIDHRRKKKLNYEMKSFPSVIATQGCFAWRNAAPLSIKKNFMLGLGNDKAPIRLIILHLMNALNRRLRGTNEQSGLNINLDAYINNIDPPKFTSSCGKAVNPSAATVTSAVAKKKSPSPVIKKPALTRVEKKADIKPAKPFDKAPEAKKVISSTPPLRTETKPFEKISESKPAEEITVSSPVTRKAEPAPVKKVVDSKPADEINISAPIEKKAEPAPTKKVVDPKPADEINFSAPIEKKAEPAPVKKVADPKPADEISISAPAAKKAEPAPLEKKPVSAPAAIAEKKPEDSLTLETYDVFTSPTATSESTVQATGSSSSPRMNLSGKVPDITDFIEPELAQPEFIEPEIFQPEPEPEPDPVFDLKTSPDPDDDPFEATLKMSSADAKKFSSAAAKPKLEDNPDPEPDPFESTSVMSSVDAKEISSSANKAMLEDKPEPESDPFTETIQMPTHELEEISAKKKPTGSVPAKDSNPGAKNGQTHVKESDPEAFTRTIPQ